MKKKGKHGKEWTPIYISNYEKGKAYIQRLPGKAMGGSILIPDIPPRASRGVGVGILVKSRGSPGGGDVGTKN